MAEGLRYGIGAGRSARHKRLYGFSRHSVFQFFSPSAFLPPMPRVTSLFVYPVKSLRGYAVPAAELDALGFAGDRRFLLVDATGKFMTQRTAPRMACIDAKLADGTLMLSAEGAAG